MVRSFIAIPLPDEIKQHVSDVQKRLEKLPIDAKFVEKDNLHITLSFLGDRNDVEIRNVSRVLDEVCSRHRKFTANINNIELIPNETYLRVISLDTADAEMESLRIDISKAIEGDSKPSHLTLCRVRSVGDKHLFKAGLQTIKVLLSFEVNEVVLFESKLGVHGPVYSVLHKSALA